MILGRQNVPGRPSTAGNNDSKDAFNEPTNIAFAKDGALLVSDGYLNSRVIKFGPNGQYLTHWGRKGTGDGEFNLASARRRSGQSRPRVCSGPHQ